MATILRLHPDRQGVLEVRGGARRGARHSLGPHSILEQVDVVGPRVLLYRLPQAACSSVQAGSIGQCTHRREWTHAHSDDAPAL